MSQWKREFENQRNNAPGRYPAQKQNRQDRGSNQHIQAQSDSYMDQNEQNRSQNNISKGLEIERQLQEYQYQLNRPRTRSSLRNAEIGSRLSPVGRGMPPQRDNPPMQDISSANTLVYRKLVNKSQVAILKNSHKSKLYYPKKPRERSIIQSLSFYL